MDRRLLLSLGLALGLIGLFFTGLALSAPPPPPPPAKVAPLVWEAAIGGETEFLVILTEQADLGAAANLSNREARLRYVYDALRETALRSQTPLRAELDGAGVDYGSFYVANLLVVRGNRALVTQLAARPDVARIAANPRVRQTLPQPQFDIARLLSPQGIEWGVSNVNADDVWTLGYTGTNVVVAGQDTGYDWDHPALINQYRGWNGVTATHDYNWHDAIHTNDPHTPAGNPCGFDSPIPCDDHGHGTHTMGTIVGDDGAGNQVGVAPGARWISCRNMEEGWGTPATYIECFEFFLAPYPTGGDPITDGLPSLAPHVINNSWTCPTSEGCDWDTLQTVVENVRAAGIVVVASAGNSGSSCGTVYDPPAIYDAAFSVGATDSGDNIASFSSRGPVTRDGSNRPKPDVSAPGVSIRSSRSGGGYTSMQGTSMAGPHVAGTVALLWSAAPR
ncbi:MAG: S8 family serine peptidase, partial [Chloroflexota bacterium]|nr:S8 family serine peptidase [Chloroflexota bacterium]